jgi:uncharacterized protein YgiB involved in biofilm formation
MANQDNQDPNLNPEDRDPPESPLTPKPTPANKNNQEPNLNPEDRDPPQAPPISEDRQNIKPRIQYQSHSEEPLIINDRQNIKPRNIRRQEIWWGVAISAGAIAFIILPLMLSGDGENSEEANEEVNAVFYQDVAQCEADMQQQHKDYLDLLVQYQGKQIAQAPTPPPMQPQDCAPQMQAAQQEHDRNAPIYNSLDDCQAEGVECEPSKSNSTSTTTTYRPIYGGTYIDPYYSPSYTYINYGGTQYRVYEPRTVYRSSTPGSVVTPHGRTISQSGIGKVIAPRHSTFAAPSRPTGTSAKGTIRGRSSQGFGSSFKSTGLGGK